MRQGGRQAATGGRGITVTPELREQIIQALWPEGAKSKLSVWGVLDCARDPQIYLALLESRLEFRCLYSGRLPRELEINAPHLVELFPTSRLTARWLDEGWGHAWGVFLSTDDASSLRHHLRKFLKVRSEDGRSLLFRYYDPRVLRAYLPTCLPGELQQLFGPVDAWMMEGDGGKSLLSYKFRAGRLATHQANLSAANEAQQSAAVR
jgi:Domain of unknown function (DUF4123)